MINIHSSKFKVKVKRVVFIATAALIPSIMPIMPIGVNPASAASCPLQSPNFNNGEICGNADFLTGSGKILVSGASMATKYYRIEVQSKIGTTAWATRCTVTSAFKSCTGTSGFATPPPNSNTKVRLHAYLNTGGDTYFDVNITQV